MMKKIYTMVLQETNEMHPFAKLNEEIVANISTFMKRNKKITHIDLSHCNLTEYMLWGIGQALSRCKSLICLHLSGNQGITP